jgi:hypothetical protein
MLIEKEIPGASDQVADAPDLLEVRTSKRGRIPKRKWPENEASKQLKQPRQKRQRQLPTPNSTQNSTQFTIFEDQPIAEPIAEPIAKSTAIPTRKPLESS